MIPGRRSFVAGAAAAYASLAIRPVAAAAYSWKFAHASTAEHPINVRAVQAAGLIRSDTNGQLDIRTFPENQLGNVTEMLTQLRLGAIEVYAVADGVLDGVVPLASINNVGFAFPSRAVVFQAMDGKLGEAVRAAVAAGGIVMMEKIWENGFRDFTNSVRPIRVASDLDGLKMRVSPSKLRLDMFRSMGVAVTPLASNELYTAMQTHVVDGQETPLVFAESQRYYEVQKYASLTHHMWSGNWVAVNQNHWRSLPPKLQEAFRRRMNEAADHERRDIGVLDGSIRDKLQREGLAVNEVNRPTFKARLEASGFYARWKAQFGDEAWGALERYSGKLA